MAHHELLAAAYEQGGRAYRQGLPLEKNPHRSAPGSQSELLHGAWIKGWREQNQKAQRA